MIVQLLALCLTLAIVAIIVLIVRLRRLKGLLIEVAPLIENMRSEKRSEVTGLARLGEELLKLKEFQTPEVRAIIERGLHEGKKALEKGS